MLPLIFAFIFSLAASTVEGPENIINLDNESDLYTKASEMRDLLTIATGPMETSRGIVGLQKEGNKYVLTLSLTNCISRTGSCPNYEILAGSIEDIIAFFDTYFGNSSYSEIRGLVKNAIDDYENQKKPISAD
jgi:hypothetical protein